MATADGFQRPTSYVNAIAVTPNNSTDISPAPCRALYIGTAGTLKVDTAQGATVTFGNVAVGVLDLAVKRVHSTGTGASNIVALY